MELSTGRFARWQFLRGDWMLCMENFRYELHRVFKTLVPSFTPLRLSCTG